VALSSGDLTATVYHVAMPMKRSFGHAHASRSQAESVIVRLRRDDVEGVGECVARDYVTGETPRSVCEALASFALDPIAEVLGAGGYDAAVPLLEELDLPARLQQGGRPGLAAACALELAVLDALGHLHGVSIRDAARPLGLPDALLADTGAPHRFCRAVDASRTPESIASIFAPGEAGLYSVLKVKVGLGREVDLERVRATREAVGPDVTVCVDANMAWSLDEACQMVDLLSPLAIEWYEEPLARGALAECAQLRRRTGARVMLDESLASRADADRALAEDACDLFNIRIAKNGGFIASLRLAELAARHQRGAQLGTHPGSQAILRAAEWQLMHTIVGFVAVEAARSNAWVSEELIDEALAVDPITRRTRRLEGPGLGVRLVPERLQQHAQRTTELGARRATWSYGASPGPH
jgi:L-Ala-D/L-Glu epimerase